jgi:hypothetical protein
LRGSGKVSLQVWSTLESSLEFRGEEDAIRKGTIPSSLEAEGVEDEFTEKVFLGAWNP